MISPDCDAGSGILHVRADRKAVPRWRGRFPTQLFARCPRGESRGAERVKSFFPARFFSALLILTVIIVPVLGKKQDRGGFVLYFEYRMAQLTVRRAVVCFCNGLSSPPDICYTIAAVDPGL